MTWLGHLADAHPRVVDAIAVLFGMVGALFFALGAFLQNQDRRS